MKSVPLADLEAMAAQVDGGLFVRWMKQAQKAALIEWRDRTATPGLAARFTHGGEDFYGFTPRTLKYNKQKGGLPDFVRTGGLREMVKARTPRSQNNGNLEAITTLKFGGGALNFLQNITRTSSEPAGTKSNSVTIKAYVRRGPGGKGQIAVNSYLGTRKSKTYTKVTQTINYAAEYGQAANDLPWIEEKVKEHFLRIFRSAAVTKGGRLKPRVMDGMDTRGGA